MIRTRCSNMNVMQPAFASPGSRPLCHPTPVLRGNRCRTRREVLQMVSTGFGKAATPSAAVAKAVEALNGESPAVALVASTIDVADTVAEAMARLLPGVGIHGMTSCGGVLGAAGSERGVGVLLIAGDGASVASARIESGSGAFEAGVKAAKGLIESLGKGVVKNVLVGASPNSEEAVLAGVASVLGDVPVFGGSAADDTVEGNWSIITSGSGVFSSGCSLVGLSDKVGFGACLVPPYTATERTARITAAEGRTIKSLDGRRAADVLREWIGDSIHVQAKEGGSIIVESAGFPIGIEKIDGTFISIHAASIEKDGSIGLFAEAKTGETLTVMAKKGGKDSATAAAIGLREAYDGAMAKGGLASPSAGLMIYCGGLSIAVGDLLNDSLSPLANMPPILGVNAFGEQGRMGESNKHTNLAVGFALFE